VLAHAPLNRIIKPSLHFMVKESRGRWKTEKKQTPRNVRTRAKRKGQGMLERGGEDASCEGVRVGLKDVCRS
jgi:hypothetical protein